MFFTREDILKIQQALLQLGVKDSELPSTEYATYDDTLSIVQDGKNKKIEVKDFFNQISLWKKEDFLNITDKYDKHYISLIDAINLVPILQRKDGLVITFQDTNYDWRIYQFRGNITEFLNKEKWFDLYDYRNYIVQSIVPDEEDLTASIPDENGNSLVYLKDRVYNPTIFNGKGYKFVRKNIINVELATIKISVTNPTTLEGDIYFNINNKGTKVHLSPTIHNTTKLVAEAIKNTLTTTYTDYKVTVANSVVTLTHKYSGNTSPTTFEMYNTGVKVIVEDYTTISERNIITQEDINKADTIYEIRYNFDLDGKIITIPKNCVLYFTSGKFYNGSINMNNTVISTLYEDILSEVNINGNYYNIQEHIKNHQRQLDDKQSQIDDKQQQITANDEDISLLQTRSTQMEETIKSIAATGGASQAAAVTYNNEKSKLTAVNIQSAVDEVVDKASIKNEDGTVVETPFRYIQNEEFIFAKVDAEEKLLFGIQWDGTPVFGKTSAVEDRLQTQVNLLADKITTILGDDDTTNAIDTLKELKDFFANINNTQTLTRILENLNNVSTKLGEDIKKLQDTKVDKEEGKSLIEDEVKECFRVIENEEFIKAIVDADNKVLFGFYRATGKPYYPQNDMYHISQSEEFLWVIIDAANHPLLGIQQDGTCWAAKAQWLDDIKAIKESLLSIDETLKTFQPKEEGKGLINLDVADSLFYISNDEYIIAVVDSENRILAGIKYDGEPYFPNHEMYSVITNEEWLYAIIDAEDKVLCGFRANDGHMIVGGIDISTFIANAIIDIADIKERTSHLSTTENDEYLSVETDAEGKVIGYIAPDGSHYFYKVKSETIPTEFEHIEDPESRTEITTDAEGKILGYREEDGTRFENSFKTKKLSMPSDGLSDFAKQLSKSGLTSSGACDWSNYNSNNGEKPLQLPIPNCAIINISNADKSASWAESKNSNFVYTLEYSDMQGNYFKKNIIMNAQGNSSLMMIKKNASIDLFDESVYDSEGNKGNGAAFSIKFGDWVAQDGFHLKAFYNDFFKGCSFIVYQIANEVMKSYGLTKDRPWKRALIGDYTGTGQDGKQIDDISLQIDNGARCMPDGFPCIAYLNGKFYGVFTFALKKHRDNYHMSKKKAEHIHLDGTNQTFFDGTIKWSDFEVRNPKSSLMCCTTLKEGTTEYESYSEGKELLGDDAEYFDSKNKAHVLSSKVKRSIESLSKRLTEAKALNSTIEQKAYIEKYFDVDSILDYILVATATHETDGGFANWQWITYDGIKWYICNYDKDRSFGNDNEYLHPAITEGSWMHENVSIFKFFEDLYSKELKDKWNEYVQKGIFTYENFIGKINSWVQRIGQANYEKEYDKWKEAPCNRDNLSDIEHWMLVDRANPWTWYNTYKEGSYCCDINTTKVYKAIKQSNNISVTNTEYWQDITYEASKQYNINDICGYGFSFGNIDNGFYVFKAIVNTLGNVPIKGTYGNYPRVMGYRDNIWRISNYVRQTLETIQRFVDNL